MKKEVTKKAQFTVFVILGLVMLIMTIFIISAMSSINNINAQKQARDAVSNTLDSANINYYVQSCLKLATEQAIDEIALQGGVLYDYQLQSSTRTASEPGTTHITTEIEFENEQSIKTNVSYSILQNNPCEIINNNMPNYPRPNTNLAELYSIYEYNFDCSIKRHHYQDHSGFFGLNNLTRLCVQGSENAKDKSGPSPCYYNWINLTDNLGLQPIAIETLLEKRILNLSTSCIDFDILEELQGSNIVLDNQNEPSIHVTFNKKSLSVTASYPFIAQLNSGNSRSIRHDFSYASNLRIVQLHNYVLRLLAADVKDITFNLSSPINQKNYINALTAYTLSNVEDYYHPDFEIEIKNIECDQNEDCENYKHDRLLIVKDKSSTINGRPLTFITAIQNRRPALDYINKFNQERGYNLFVIIGDELKIEPQGYDPDDGILTYTYSGWKSEELMESELFLTTKKDANYTTTQEDEGIQNISVHVCDEAGLCDYQDIKIFIFDPPTLTIAIESIFDEKASIEDFITLRGGTETTNDAIVSDIVYKWEIQKDDTQIWIGTTDNDGNELKIPQDINEYNINEELIKIIKQLQLNQTGAHKIILNAEVTYNEIEGPISAVPIELDLDVKACLPHRSNILSYPYNTGENIFSANHTCCDDDDTILGDEINCYTATFYGEFNKLKQKAQDQLKTNALPSPTETSVTFQPLNQPPNTKNDIFKMTLTRNCDGNRGNICAGPLTASLTSMNDCAYDSNLLEQCKGPANIVSENQNQVSCVSYTTTNVNNPQSFEFIYRVHGATGKCNTGAGACSTIGSNGYDSNGKYWCTAAYCNNGNCEATFNDNTCKCDARCDAQCYEGKTYEWIGNECSYSACIDCEFSRNQETKCPKPNIGEIAQCYNQDDGFCYVDVTCTNQGTNQGKQDYCKRGGLFETRIRSDEQVQSIPVKGCVFGTLKNPVCTNGNCNYHTDYFTCESGYEAQCHQSEGAKCQNPSGLFSNPIKYTNVEIRTSINPI